MTVVHPGRCDSKHGGFRSLDDRCDAGEDNLFDESTILRFRHILEAHTRNLRILTTVNARLIAVAGSTKDSGGRHGPEMHWTKKGNHWHFGMKVHIGAWNRFGLGAHLQGQPIGAIMEAVEKSLKHGAVALAVCTVQYPDGAPNASEGYIGMSAPVCDAAEQPRIGAKPALKATSWA